MSKQAINPNNLPVVRVVQKETAALSGPSSQVVMASIYNGDDTLCVSECLVPLGLEEYDFVWIEPMAVEAMWLSNELIIDSSEPVRPFKGSRLLKAVNFAVKHKRALFWLLGALFFPVDA